MRLSKKKNSALLAAMLLFICSAFVVAGQSAVDATEKSIFSDSPSLADSQRNAETTDDSHRQTRLRRMTIAVLGRSLYWACGGDLCLKKSIA